MKYITLKNIAISSGIFSLLVIGSITFSSFATTTYAAQTMRLGTNQLDALRIKGLKLVDERLALLSNVKREIKDNTSITDTARTTMFANTDKYYESMVLEKDYINNPNATVQDLQYHINAIWTNNRIYLVVVPALRLSTRGFAVDMKSHDVLGLVDGFTTRIQEGYTQGKDSSVLNNLETRLRDMQMQATQANDVAQKVSADALALSPSSYMGDNHVVDAIREKADAATKAMQQAQSQQQAIEAGLQTLGL